ncbi:MAG: MarR family transcriptional regulator [Spirochaetes bacterium]|nr:MarR family transcriptional regulator [Spirochaetota bacterium]
MATKYQGNSEEKRALDLFIKLMRTHDSLENKLRHEFRDFKLTPPQFGILETLYHLGPLQQHVLASKLLKSAGNITRVLDGMQESGLIERRAEPGDRRSFRIHLTPKGKKTIEKIFPDFVAGIRTLFGALAAGEQEQLNQLLRKLGTHIRHSYKE